MSTFWARYEAWWQRNRWWWWTAVSALSLWAGGIQDDGGRWVFLTYAVFAMFWAGWHWRAWAQQRRARRIARQVAVLSAVLTGGRLAADDLARLAESGVTITWRTDE